MAKIILGYLHSGEKVYDRSPSHIHESAAPYVQEALLKVNSESREKLMQWLILENLLAFLAW